MSENRVPITLLTGFLGAGKSTFLNRILRQPGADRIAVIVNEYGEVGLDHDLIKATDENITLLESGCVCCSVRADLAKAIPELLARRAKGGLRFDRIVLETTGLADPAPVQRTLMTDPALRPAVHLDGIVTLVDAVNGARTLDQQFEAVSQVGTADLLLLSKTELAPPGQVAALTRRLSALNTGAQILNVGDAAADLGLVWGCCAMRGDVTAREAMAWLAPAAPPVVPAAADPLANLSGLAPAASPAPAPVHDARITSASITLDRPLPRAALGAWLDRVTELRGENILRMKGIVFLEGEPAPFVFHGVQHVFDAPVALSDWAGSDSRSRVVLIARDVPQAELAGHLELLRMITA